MRGTKAPDKIDTWRIVCAAQSQPDYSEDRQILYYGGDEFDYHGNGPFVVLDGGPDSTFDWEGVEWYATEYTRDEILRLAKSKTDGDGCYSKSERMFWKMVLMAVDGKAD